MWIFSSKFVLLIKSAMESMGGWKFDLQKILKLLEAQSKPGIFQVHSTLGTSSAVAVVISPSGPSTAVAVFREDYAHPRSALVGRCRRSWLLCRGGKRW